MGLLRFEFKKLLKQKKYIWAFIVIVLITSAIYAMNANQRSKLQGRWVLYGAMEEYAVFDREWSRRESELIKLRDERGLNYQEEKQLEYSREIGLALQRIRISLFFDFWPEVNRFEQRFLNNLDSFTRLGGEFSALEGINRDILIAKNQWRINHDIQYEYEKSPISQHLFLVESLSVVLGIIGIVTLLILFGNTLVEEKENYTWQTLKTQPISRLKLVLSKYSVFLVMSLVFIFVAFAVGLLLPMLLSKEWTLIFKYPQILTDGESFKIITTFQYILRAMVLFFCVSSMAFSLNLVLSKWTSKSFVSYFVVGIVLVVGYLTNYIIQSPLNPFYLLNFSEILNRVPSNYDWIFVVSAFFYSGLFLTLTVFLPESQAKPSQTLKLEKPFASGNTKAKGKLLWIMHSFEWRKVKREGILRTLSVILLLLMVGGHFLLTKQVEQRKAGYLAELEWRVPNSQERISYLQERIEEMTTEISNFVANIPEHDSNQDDLRGGRLWWHYARSQAEARRIEYLVELVDIFGNNLTVEINKLDKLKGAIKGYHEGDWISFYEYQHAVNQFAFEHTYPDGRHMGKPETIGRFSKLVSVHEKEVLIERNIRPVFSGEFINTIHEPWRGNRVGWRGEGIGKEQWAYENKKVDNSGLFYLYLSYTHFIYLIPILLLLFLAGGGMAKEKGKKKTFNFLKTQPLTQEKLFLGKVINSFSIVLCSALVIPLLVVLVGTVLNRFGDWNYPILYYYSFRTTMNPEFTGYTAGGHGYDFISLGKFLLDSTMLFIALSLLVVATANFLSIFFKRTMGVWAATIILGVGGYWLNGKNPLRVSHLSPFTYFNIPKISNGELGAVLNDPRVSVQTGVMVLLIITLVIMLLGYWLLNRKKALETASDNISKGINIEKGK